MQSSGKPNRPSPSFMDSEKDGAANMARELLVEIQALRSEIAAQQELAATRLELSAEKGRHEAASAQVAEARAEIELLRTELRRRDEQLEVIETRQSYKFARTLIEVRGNPRLAWKLPVSFIKLVLPSRVLQATKRVRSRVQHWRSARKFQLPSLASVVINEAWPRDRPLVSVVIPCFNYGRFLPEALNSIQRQTLQDYEIILIEGGSTDETTADIVRAAEAPRLRKIFQPRPTRVGVNRLAGIESSRGKYVVFLDADDLLEPTYLEKAVMALELTGVDLAYPSVQMFDRKDTVWETADEFTLENIAKVNNIATVAAFRVETWRTLKLGYGIHVNFVEDWDFWLRFAERGARGWKIHQPLMRYRVHGNSLTDRMKNPAEVFAGVLAEHGDLVATERARLVSEQQRQFPEVQRPLINLTRLERRRDASLRIALAVPWLAIGGSDSLLLQLFADLPTFDAKLCVYTTLGAPPSMGTSAPAFHKLTDDVFELQKELPPSARADAIVHLLRSRDINILMIVGSSMTYELLPRIRRELPQIKIIDHLYNTVGHLESNRRFASSIDFNIVANHDVFDALVAGGESPDRICTIHHAIDMEHHAPALVPWSRDGFAALPLRSNEKLVVYAGRFSQEKGVLRFVDLVRRMRDDERLIFAMLGDGPQRPLVESLIKEHQIGHRVRLLGFVPDSRPYLRRADVVIIPSDVEGLPLVCLEALALGTPVVASAVGALPQVIEDGVTGALANPKDLDSFASAIQIALALDANRERLARRCRASVVVRFSIGQVREQYFEVFRRLAGADRPALPIRSLA